VADRIIYFNENYKNGSITTELITEHSSDKIIIKATVTPDIATPQRFFTGYSQATVGQGYINKTSALENAETSAVGRALAMMGIGVIESVASVDEINKAKTEEQIQKLNKIEEKIQKVDKDDDKKKQIKKICDLKCKDKKLVSGEDYKTFVLNLTGFELLPENYDSIIDSLKSLP